MDGHDLPRGIMDELKQPTTKTPMYNIVHRVAQAERLQEEIMLDRHQIIALDTQQNANREALGHLERKKLKTASKVWMNMGEFFIKMPRETSIAIVKEEQTTLRKQIETVRNDLSTKVATLKETEGERLNPGFDLKAVARKDLYGKAHG